MYLEQLFKNDLFYRIHLSDDIHSRLLFSFFLIECHKSKMNSEFAEKNADYWEVWMNPLKNLSR
jgi:hypothetical protein